MKIWSRFAGGKRGNVTITFALTVLPLLLAVGAAIDMIRADEAKTALQSVADAAALAAGASPSTTEAELRYIAEDYVSRNFSPGTVKSIDSMEFSTADDTQTIAVQLKGEFPTSFFALVGVTTFDINVKATVERAADGPLELVMALDITDSMSLDGKLEALKSAATKLTQSVMVSDNAKVGIVPFSDYLNIGLSRRNEFWVDVPDDKTSTATECDTEYPDKQNCSIEPVTCFKDGVEGSCEEEVCESWGDPVQTNCAVRTDVDTWDGCVASRAESLRSSIGSVSTPYPGVLEKCGPEIQTLTDDESTVLSVIDNLYVWGNTHIPSGLIWGWNMLTPEEPLTEARDASEIADLGGRKVLVLMTDGSNTTSPYGADEYRLNAETSYGDATYANQLTTTLCDNIKDEGIEIYTVLFDVTDQSVTSLLEDCASAPANSFVAADSDELIDAFSAIGKAVKQLRLTE